jgi:hypothetical protein
MNPILFGVGRGTTITDVRSRQVADQSLSKGFGDSTSGIRASNNKVFANSVALHETTSRLTICSLHEKD